MKRSEAEELTDKRAEIEQLADECLDLLAADEANVIPINDGATGQVQFFAHLRKYHGWDGIAWLGHDINDEVSDIHDAEHEEAAITGPVGIEDLLIPHAHPAVAV